MMRKKVKKNKTKQDGQKIHLLFLRYLFLLLLAFPNLQLLYAIFTPLTIYPVYFFLKLFFSVSLSNNIIILNGFTIQLVKACIAGSAYYLLLILNLTTPMPLKKRLPAIFFSLSCFLLINIARIFLFSILFLQSFSIFSLTHLVFWYFLSSAIVFAIWFAEIKLFKIYEIPVYSDIKFLCSKIKLKQPVKQAYSKQS